MWANYGHISDRHSSNVIWTICHTFILLELVINVTTLSVYTSEIQSWSNVLQTTCGQAVAY